MGNNNLEEFLSKRYVEKIKIEKTENNIEISLEKDILTEVAEFCKDMGFHFLSDISSVDYKEYFLVVYQLFSYTKNESITIKVRIDNRDNPIVDSLVKLWETADWHEREIYDLMGITFKGHPNMKKILMWEGFKGHPLRKDFSEVKRKRSWEVE